MTSSLDSMSTDDGVGSSIEITAAATGLRSPTRPASAANAMIGRVTVLLFLNVFNICGNSFTLITIRMTPRLWTKTNYILASMLVSNVMLAVLVIWYTFFILVVYVFSNPCHNNVLITALTPLMKINAHVSIFHLILISVERYIAIVYPLHYETKFTNRTLKWTISVAWVAGILIGMTYPFWLVNADLRICTLIPVHYQLVEVFVFYMPVCSVMFICYGKILVIWWHQRRRVGPTNPSPGSSLQTTTFTSGQMTQRTSKALSSDNTTDQKNTSLTEPAMTSYAASAADERQKRKSRLREFKAVYLTAAIVGTFVVTWIPHILGRIMASAGVNPVIVNYIGLVGGAVGSSNFAFSWAIYAAVSKSYRRAYRQTLISIGCCCCKNITLQAADHSLIA